MTGPLADLISQAEHAVVGPAEPGAADRRADLRMVISMQLEAGALAGDEVDDDEAARLCHLAVLLAHLQEHELGLRLLRDGVARTLQRCRRARLATTQGVLLAESGRLAEARTVLRSALADAVDAPAVHAGLAVLGSELGDADDVRILAGNAATLAAGVLPEATFDRAFARLRIALLREETDEAAQLLDVLGAAGDEIVRRRPAQDPTAVAAVADLAYTRFHLADPADDGDRSACMSVLRAAALLLGVVLGERHPRTRAVRIHLAECELRLAVDRATAVRILAAARQTAADAAGLLGADHPQAVAAAAVAARAGLAVAEWPRSTDPEPALDGPSALAEAVAELRSVAETAERVFGTWHPLAVLAAADSALAGLTAVGSAAQTGVAGSAEHVEDRLMVAAARVAVVFGVRHSTARRLDAGLRACRRMIAAAGDGAPDGVAEAVAAPLASPDRRLAAAGNGAAPADDGRDHVVAADAGRDHVVAADAGRDHVVAAGAEQDRHGVAAEAAPVVVGDGATDPGESRAAEQARLWGALAKIKDDDGTVRGRVVEVVKGGLVLDVGVRAFLPASLVELRRVRDLNPYVGRELTAKIAELDATRGNLVLSRRAHLEQSRSQDRTALLGQLRRGQIRRGVVSSVVNFGAFVDLGGIDGLIATAELSWAHHNHPSDVVDVGQEVDVEVLEVDAGRGRISLSLKSTQQDPWPQFARLHPIGQIVPGRVTKLMPFGAFVRVDGLEGLVHVSELAEQHVDSPDQVVRAGMDLLVKVTDIDLQRRRLSLSLKQANAEFVEDETQFDPGMYGMINTYDADGNYVYPEGFDAQSAEWLPGFEEQREAWEQAYADARQRWEAHGRQVRAARDPGPGAGTGADERLAALRQRLSNGNRSGRQPG